MHRCGSSALALLLRDIGLFMGDRLLAGTPSDNPLGYGEDAEAVRINKIALAQLGEDETSILTPARIGAARDALVPARLLAQALVRRRERHALWAFKDPRTGPLLPMWRDALAAENRQARLIVAVRHPASASLSLFGRNNIPLAWGALLWLASYVSLADGQEPRLFVDYDELLRDPLGQTARIATWLGLDASPRPLKHLQPALRHHWHVDPADGRADLPPIIHSVWRRLEAAALNRQGGEPELVNAELKRAGDLLHEFDPLWPAAQPKRAGRSLTPRPRRRLAKWFA